MPFNVDGEPCAMTPVTFELLPRALEVLVGPDEAGADEAQP
jgi:diacylglycerol kinase family enzyme